MAYTHQVLWYCSKLSNILTNIIILTALSARYCFIDEKTDKLVNLLKDTQQVTDWTETHALNKHFI